MDDMLAWLILAYAHEKRGTKLEVYAQIPKGNSEDEIVEMKSLEKRLGRNCLQCYRDAGAVNVDAILNYQNARMAKLHFTAKPDGALPSAIPLLTYEDGVTEDFVKNLFKKDRGSPTPTRIEMLQYENSPLLQTISSFCGLLEERLAHPAFTPAEHKRRPINFGPDDANKKILVGKLAARDFTNLFELAGKKLKNCRVILAWHGCPANRISSILRTGFAAFGDLDSGYFGSGNYTALESSYASQYARGDHDDKPEGYPDPKTGECAVILTACLVGYCYPVTPNTDDFPRARGDARDCKWYGAPLKSRYMSHIAAVNENSNFLCVRPVADEYKENQFHELVLKESAQLLPLAVVWFKK